MRPVTIILLVVALGIAGATAFLAKRLLNTRSVAPVETSRPTGQKEILLASRDISIGQALTSGDMDWTYWPEEMIDPRYVVRDEKRDAIDTFVGSTTRTGFVKGEPIQSSRLFHQGDAGFMAGMLTPGMRAVGVSVNPSSSVGGFVLPGDRVDVILSYEVKRSGNQDQAVPIGQANIYQTASQTVIRDARVLAVDQAMKAGKEAATKAKSVTLEVTQEGAQIVALSVSVGTLSLSLRPLAETIGKMDEAPKSTTDLATLEALRAALLGSETSKYKAAPAPRTRPRSRPRSSGSVKVYRGGTATNERVSQ